MPQGPSPRRSFPREGAGALPSSLGGSRRGEAGARGGGAADGPGCPAPCLPGDNGFFCLAALICGFQLEGPRVGALLGAGQAVSVRSRPKVAIVSRCVLPTPASRCCEARPRRRGPRGAAGDSRSFPPPTPRSSSPAWGRGASRGRAGPAPFPGLALAVGSWVCGIRFQA